ncbi:hypothetical protein C0993_011723 [Termitomyces sp. T159_Od127]|nr:hypothetical protein C0993_011723 [Termitomyces sp. T159_Od127]
MTIPQLYLRDNGGHSHEHLNAILLNFVQTRKFAAAEQFRIRLVREGVKIIPHMAYEQAAISCIRWDNIEASLLDLETWFALVPARDPMDQTRPPLSDTDANHFQDLRRIMFASPSTRLPVILFFGLLAATKGYIQPTVNETLPVLIRYAPVEVGICWLREMEEAILQYSAATPYFLDTLNHFRNLAIKVCCQAGWLSHAITIMTTNSQFELNISTRTLLHNALRDAGRMEELSMLDRRVRPLDPWRLQTRNPPNDVKPARLRLSYQKELLSTYCMPRRHDVAAEIRSINHQLRSSNDLDAANVTVFLSRLHEVGGASRIVKWLRARALVAGPSCSVPWLQGEIMDNLTRRDYIQVLKLYLTYFNTETQLPSPFSDALRAIEAFYRFAPLTALANISISERWLVLKSIIRLVPTIPDPVITLRLLYDTYCSENANHNEAYNVRSAFITSFGECGAPDDAVRVVKDSGKAPYLREVETLAGVLAHAGREEKTLALLRYAGSGRMEMTLVDGRVMRTPANLLMYERVIKGFVKAGLLKPALEAEIMMKKNLGQNISRSTRHLEIIEALRALEAQHTQK